MSWFNKLYHAGRADGSFDMELFTQAKEQYTAKRRRGQYLGLPAVYEPLYDEKVKTDSDTLTGYCMIPTSASNLYTNVYQILGNGSAYMWFISANSPSQSFTVIPSSEKYCRKAAWNNGSEKSEVRMFV